MNHCQHDFETIPNYNKAFAIAVLANIFFTVFEAVLALVANSSSLLADAGHNLGDILGLGMAWLASWLMTRQASPKYSYGYKRTSILAAFFNALILIATSVLIASHAVEMLLHAEPIDEMIVIVVAAVGILVNGGTALLFMKDKEDINIKAAFLHLAFDALISLGVVIAGIIVFYTHWLWIDPLAGLLIVVIILWGTWGLFNKSFTMVLDGVPHNVDIEKVREYFISLPDIDDVHDLHIWSLSTSEIALTAHLIVPKKMLSNEDYTKINCDLNKKFGINHITIQVEEEHLGDADGHIRCGC